MSADSAGTARRPKQVDPKMPDRRAGATGQARTTEACASHPGSPSAVALDRSAPGEANVRNHGESRPGAIPAEAARPRHEEPAGAALRVLVILGHPRVGSLSGALAEAFAAGAREAGCSVKMLQLSDMAFDQDVIMESPANQPLEPDLEQARRLIGWAQHLVFVFPNWWGMMPARLKGFLDRVLYPGFAFREDGAHYYGLLAPRTAELLITMDVPKPVYKWIQGAPGTKAMTRATLGLCGITTVAVSAFGPPSHTDAATREGWVRRARELGARLRDGPRFPVRRRLHAVGRWLKAVRPQFYPMSALAYTLGALLVVGPLDLLAFLFGLIAMVGLKVATVFTNDIHDYDSDVRNRHYSPFNGGGRSLQEGDLSAAEMWRGVRVALGVAALATLALVFVAPSPLTALLVLIVLAVLALGYTLPPLKLSHRGLGELDVALTHGPGVLILGHVVQGGDPLSAQAWFLALVIALAVLPAILLAGIPDRSADREAGKMTMVVRLGTARSVQLAIGILMLSALGALALGLGPVPVGLALSVIAIPHAAVLTWLLMRYLGEGAPERRIDLLLGLALLYIAWFVIVPFIGLL